MAEMKGNTYCKENDMAAFIWRLPLAMFAFLLVGIASCFAAPPQSTLTQRPPQSTIYTATLRMAMTVDAGIYRGPFGRVSGVFDQDVPPGTYRVTLTPANMVNGIGGCNCSGPGDCTCAPGACFCRECSGRKAIRFDGPLPIGPVGYDIAQRWAMFRRVPMVTFVGTPSMSIDGAIVAQETTLPGVTAPAVLIAVPGNGQMEWTTTLQGEQTATAIKAAVNRALFPPAPVPVMQQQFMQPMFAPSFGGGCST